MKILIIGTVGTGKTTLARKLSKKYNIKHYEIDSIVHDDNDNGRKRSIEEQNTIIKEIDENDWIIEGTLRKNLYYLLDMADKIIYLNVPKRKRNCRILIRYIKQKLKIEKSNYKPSIKMLKSMYKWSKEHEENRYKLEETLDKYKEKLEIIKM